MHTFKDFDHKSAICSIQKGEAYCIQDFFQINTYLLTVYFQTYRAKNRTLYLRRKITTGRGRRSYQLKLVSTQRKNQHDQLMKNSWYYQFRNWFEITVLKSSTTKCHGCDKKVKKEDFDVKDFHDVSVNICKDCQKDI